MFCAAVQWTSHSLSTRVFIGLYEGHELSGLGEREKWIFLSTFPCVVLYVLYDAIDIQTDICLAVNKKVSINFQS